MSDRTFASGLAGLRDQARRLGFDAFGVVSLADLAGQDAALRRWLALGWHGEMGWMARAERGDARLLWPAARAAVMVGVNYGDRENDALRRADQRGLANIAEYAQAQDYHDPIKQRLRSLASWLVTNHGGEARAYCDTAPLMEKPLAQAAGLGWIGKHSHLVSRHAGSWLLLGGLLVTHDWSGAGAEADHCGSCHRCIDICPTRAIRAPRRLEARRCISYLTIEHRGHIPYMLRSAIGNRVFGCDDCLAVCPWNKFAQTARDQAVALRSELGVLGLGELLGMSRIEFNRFFRGTPMRRTGWARMQRNALIAAGNSGDVKLFGLIEARLCDPSIIVRVAAIWAWGRLAVRVGGDVWCRGAVWGRAEQDFTAREEWRLALPDASSLCR